MSPHSVSHSLLIIQIGFLTEWQLYAQKVEGDSWKEAKIEEGKLAKMSGTSITLLQKLN